MVTTNPRKVSPSENSAGRKMEFSVFSVLCLNCKCNGFLTETENEEE